MPAAPTLPVAGQERQLGEGPQTPGSRAGGKVGSEVPGTGAAGPRAWPCHDGIAGGCPMRDWRSLRGRVGFLVAAFAVCYLGAMLGGLGLREVRASHNFADVPTD